MKTKFKNSKFLDIESGKKYNLLSDVKTGKFSAKVKTLLDAGKKIGLPNGYVVDKKNKSVIKTQNIDGSVNAKYRKAVMLRPDDIVNNRQNKEIYSVGNNEFLKRNEVLVDNQNYLKQKFNSKLKIRNGVIYSKVPSNYEKSPLIRKNNGLSVSRIYNVDSKFDYVKTGEDELTLKKVYEKSTPTNLPDFVESVREAYLSDFTPEERRRKNQSVLISFGDVSRWFPIKDLSADNLQQRIDKYSEYYDKSGTDRDLEEAEESGTGISSDLIDFGTFRINMTGSSKDMKGGANRENLNSKYWETNQPPTKNNECLEGAINRGLKLGKTAKTLRKIMASKFDSIHIGEMVSVYDLSKYESYFECRINLYEDRPHSEDNEIKISKEPYEKSIDLLLSNQHYFLITGKKLVLSDSAKTDLDTLGIVKKSKEPKKKKSELKEMLVIFDIETIFNKTSEQYLEPYGVSWVVWDANEKFDYDPSIHNEEPYCYYKRGQKCLRELINFLISPPDGIVYRPLGFNNSRFDNFAFCEEATRMGVLRQSFFADGTILYAVVNNTRPSWDTSRFLNGFSLDRACKSFNTNPKKAKDLIDHYEIQTFWEKHGWDGLNNLLDTNENLVLYNKLDCLCLLDLTLKIRSVFLKQNYDIFESYTISSMGYKILEDKWSGKMEFLESTKHLSKKESAIEWKKHKAPFTIIRPKNYVDDSFFRKSLFAGRTQSFYGAEREIPEHLSHEEKLKLRDIRIVETDLAMVDYKSLYPTTLGSYGHQDYYYPYGDYNKVDKEFPELCGIYLCDIIHQRCKWKSPEIENQFRILKEKTGKDFYREFAPNVIPLRTENKPLDWFYKKEMLGVYLTSEDIRILRWATEDPDCLKVVNGYVWKSKSKDLFRSYFDPPREEKTKQDFLKKDLSKLKIEFPKQSDDFYNQKMIENNGEIYSEAIRECMKLQSNGVSGKLLEAIHENVSETFSTKAFLEMEQDADITELDITDYGNGYSVITGKKSAEAVFNKSKKKKPSYLGMFCYSFSRGLMYQTLLSRYICLYMDTDSACMPLFEYDRLNNSPHIIESDLVDNGEYGCLEEEVCDITLCKVCEDREERNDRNEIKTFRFSNPMKNGLRCSDCKIKPATKLIAISPKNYAVINANAPYMDKRKFKGVRKNDFWLPLKDFGDYKFEVKNVLGVDKNIVVGDGVDVVRNLDQDQIRSIREFKCCKNCIDEVMAESSNPEFSNNCERCLTAKNRVKKTYSDEMFEYLARGEKIAVFCSVINRIKYSVKDVVEWEYKELLNGECSLETFEYILQNSKGHGSKNPIQMRFRTDEKESKAYFKDLEKAIENVKKALKPNGFVEDKEEYSKLQKSIKKQILEYVNSHHRFTSLGTQRELCESFTMKQKYMVKII